MKIVSPTVILSFQIKLFFRVKDRFKLTQALVVDPLYLQHSWTGKNYNTMNMIITYEDRKNFFL